MSSRHGWGLPLYSYISGASQIRLYFYTLVSPCVVLTAMADVPIDIYTCIWCSICNYWHVSQKIKWFNSVKSKPFSRYYLIVAKWILFRTPPYHRPDRIGPLAYAHWVWLPIADLAYLIPMIQMVLHTQSWLFICSNKPASSKTLLLVGFSPQGFFFLTTFTRDATIKTYN
jgi:hypothetical protein